MYQCFVICPFGNESRGDEEARLFAELKGLQEHVFKATEALCRKKRCPVRIVDARETDHDGDQILTATQQSIDRADAIIVILTADKPNVFLELGWAQGMWQNPILLMREGYRMPSDISNDLCVMFTDAQASGADATGVGSVAAQLAEAIIKRIRRRRAKPFEHWPATTLARGAVDVYNRFSKAISIEEWSRMIQSAEKEIIIASTRMSRIRGQKFFVAGKNKQSVPITLDQMLLQKAVDGVRVTILMYHEENITLGHLEHLQSDLPTVQADLRQTFLVWSQLRMAFEDLSRRSGGPAGAFRVVQMRKRNLPFRVTLTERRAIATIRFYTEIFNSGLCIDARCPQGPADPENVSVYQQIKDELDFLIAENSEAAEDRYNDWVKTQRRA